MNVIAEWEVLCSRFKVDSEHHESVTPSGKRLHEGLYESNQITNRDYASVEFLSASGCTGTSDTDDAPEQPDSPEPIPEGPEAEEEVEKGTGGNALASELRQ